jgi:3-dehydroquinate dehydratase-2
MTFQPEKSSRVEPAPHKKIGILNGPNLNVLGRREPEIYGHIRFEHYLFKLRSLYPAVELLYKQSNHEGDLIDHLQKWGFSLDGIVCNAAAYTHTSIALADAIRAISTPVVEVHISDLSKRESYRQTSYMRPHCIHSIMGEGLDGYAKAIAFLINR